MLNIGRLGVDGAEYYLRTVASGLEEYYLGAGEAPGAWTGSGSAALGLTGEVRAEDLRAVLAGRDPASGDVLRSGQRRVPGFDLTFRAPKSVSLLWGLGDPQVADEVRAAHDAAVAAALSYVEAHTARSRRGAGGTERVPVDGLVAAALRHRSSRAGDPLLHTHVLVANTARTSDDGKWRTVDSRRLYANAKTAGFVYQAQLRHELTRRLGVTWRPVANGWADLTGVPDRVIRAFSQRRAAIEAHMAARGETSAAAAQTATLVTRAAKDPTVSFAALHADWQDRADRVGFHREQVQRMVGRRPPGPTVAAIADQLLGPDGLTERASTFDRRDVVHGWCDRLPAGAPIQTIEVLTDALLADDNPHLVRLNAAGGDDPRWTTVELLEIEQRALRGAVDRQAAAVGVAERAAVDAAVARRLSLSAEQAVMVRELTGSGRGLDVVIGKAGTGKTYALDAARTSSPGSSITPSPRTPRSCSSATPTSCRPSTRAACSPASPPPSPHAGGGSR